MRFPRLWSGGDSHNTITVLRIGFSAILALMLVVGMAGIYQLRQSIKSLSDIVEINNTKIEYAYQMRDAVHLRQISMNLMLSMEDPFERDQEANRYYSMAAHFREAREHLLNLPLNEHERTIHRQLSERAQIAQPQTRVAIEALKVDIGSTDVRNLVKKAQFAQQQILVMVDALVSLQKKYERESLAKSKTSYEQLLYWLIGAGLLVLLLALMIGRVVTRFVAQKNAELITKNRALKQASQEALEATRTKSAFLANMSHEIRTPLTGIIGFSEILMDRSLPLNERRDLLKTIIYSGRHLLKVINDILDISKIEANKLEFEAIRFSPFELLADVEHIVGSQIRDKGLVFKLEYRFPLPNAIVGDPLRIKQVLLNLCSNANKFTESGRISIRVSCDRMQQLMYFEVADTGIGMNSEQAQKVFDSFQQADSSISRKYGGTGIGLSLSKQFAEHMGGTITVDSLVGVGSRFNFSVQTGDLAEADWIDSVSDIQIKEAEHETPAVLHKVSGDVLVAEDNENNQRLIKLLLQKMGAQVTFADNGQEAVKKARQNDYQLVLMDMQMPVLGGIDAVRDLRHKGYDKPIVMLTANAMQQDKDNCIAAGCNDFLTKPIDRVALSGILAKYLQVVSDDNVDHEPIISDMIDIEPAIVEIVYDFIAKLPAHMTNLQDLMADRNWDRFEFVIHQLKGLGASMGYSMISEIAEEIEIELEHKRYMMVATLTEQLSQYCDRIALGVDILNEKRIANNITPLHPPNTPRIK